MYASPHCVPIVPYYKLPSSVFHVHTYILFTRHPLISQVHCVVLWCFPPSDAPRLDRPDQDKDCYQEVTVTLQQPVPNEMYYAFAKTAESCTGVGQNYSVNITTGESRLEFTVNVGQSGLDTRREVYLVSWYTMNGVMGPCSNELMKPTGMHVYMLGEEYTHSCQLLGEG